MAKDGRSRGIRSLFGIHNVPAPVRPRDAPRLPDRTADAQEGLGLDKEDAQGALVMAIQP